MRILPVIIAAVMVLTSGGVYALTVEARSTSAGVYEDGEFRPGGGSFEAVYTIDEDKRTVRLDRIIKNDREGKYFEGAVYEITNMVVGEGLSGLVVPLDKMHQKIITAVNDTDVGSTEMIMIGKDFYDYCRAANGRLYLEHGTVKTGE